jgi:hypothetical protein
MKKKVKNKRKEEKMSFKKTKFKVIREAIPRKVANFIYRYFKNKRHVARFLFDQRYISQFAEEWGRWNDPMIPNTYFNYADIAFETVLNGLTERMEKESGYKLNPSYTYACIYKKGDVLYRHFDRDACKISATMHIGDDGTKWPIYLDPTGKAGKDSVPVNMEPGDMLIYHGNKHWREAFTGEDYCQVFLHWNKDSKKKVVTGKDNTAKGGKHTKFDGRPFLGLPAYYKGFILPKN